jgi:hypothetical protein
MRVKVQAGLGKTQDPIPKITKVKRWGIALVVEHLLSKHNALSSNPSSTRNKRKQQGRGKVWQRICFTKPKN